MSICKQLLPFKFFLWLLLLLLLIIITTKMMIMMNLLPYLMIILKTKILFQKQMKEKKRVFIERNREEGHKNLWNYYFSETPTYPKNLFRRRFRMNKPLFLRIVHRLSTEVQYFQPSEDATGRSSLSPLQKCTAAIRQLAYGGAADTVDEYVRLVKQRLENLCTILPLE